MDKQPSLKQVINRPSILNPVGERDGVRRTTALSPTGVTPRPRSRRCSGPRSAREKAP